MIELIVVFTLFISCRVSIRILKTLQPAAVQQLAASETRARGQSPLPSAVRPMGVACDAQRTQTVDLATNALVFHSGFFPTVNVYPCMDGGCHYFESLASRNILKAKLNLNQIYRPKIKTYFDF